MNADITIWCIDLATMPAIDTAALASLSDAERTRFDGFSSRHAARVFATTRLALRQLLSRRVGRPPSEIALSITSEGKPFCTQMAHGSFSISHAAEWAVVSFSDRLEVGIDIEPWASFVASNALWPVACSAGEVDWLRRHSTRADQEFARLWVRKEALAKALGKGLHAALPELDLAPSIEAAQGKTTVRRRSSDVDHLAWNTLDLLPGFAAAIAAVTDGALQWDIEVFEAPAR